MQSNSPLKNSSLPTTNYQAAPIINEMVIQAALDEITLANVAFLGAWLGGFYTLIAAMHMVLLPPALARILVPLAGLTAVVMIALRLWCRKHSPVKWANQLATLISALVYLNSILHLYLSQDPKQATNLMMLIIGVGFLHLHTHWYLWNLLVFVGGWILVVSIIGPSPDNIHFGFGGVIGAALSYFIHRSRVKTLGQNESMRWQSEQRSLELEAALIATKEAQHRDEVARHELQIALQALEKTKAELEDRVQERTAELHRSNRELQDFASIASHDLQEPLRKVQAFGSRLHDKYGALLGATGNDYLARMQNAASRMQTLINDLLTFSRVTSKAKPFETVDLAQIMTEVMADLEIRIEQTRGRLEIEHLPVLQADATQMRQLLQNLIGNALKFHKPNEVPLIKIRCKIIEQFCRIEISDNGIGFDEKYSEQIFTIFQRLHGRETYEGTGVGLAVCRKIVERHGGTIVAQSVPNQGATFIISLPYQTQEKSIGTSN